MKKRFLKFRIVIRPTLYSLPPRFRPISKQRGYGEEFFAVFMAGVGLLFVLVYGIAIWIGKGLIGKLIALVVASVLLSPIWFPVLRSSIESKTWQNNVNASSKICEAELKKIPSTIHVESLLDETGGLRTDDLQHLLVDVGLHSIELNLEANRGRIASGDTYDWKSQQDAAYVHLELGDSASPNCYFPSGQDKSNFFTERAPMKPGACLQVTYLAQPTATNILTETQNTQGRKFSQWVIKDRRNDSTIAGITDAFRLPKYPVSNPRWDRRGNQNSCQSGRSGYGLLLDRISGTTDTDASTNPWTLKRRPLKTTGIPPTLSALAKEIEERALPTLNSSDRAYYGDKDPLKNPLSWTEAYANAIKYGGWVHENILVSPREGVIYDIYHSGLYGKWGTTGSQLILVQANSDDKVVTVFGVDFHGVRIWSAQTMPLTPWTTSSPLRFQPEQFELTRNSMLIHGTYGHSVGEDNWRPWTVSIPLSELTAMQMVAEKGTEK